MSTYDDIFDSIPPFTRHKVGRKMKREAKAFPPEPPLTLEQEAENNRIAMLIEKWAVTGEVFAIPTIE